MKLYPAPMPTPDRLHASLVALVKRCRADRRKSKRAARTALIRGEYADEILAILEQHIAAAANAGGIHPKLAPAIRAWLIGRRPVDLAPEQSQVPVDACPDCGQDLTTPQTPCFRTDSGLPVWCAYCEGCRPRQMELTEVIDSAHACH